MPGSRIAQPDSIRRVSQNPGFERNLLNEIDPPQTFQGKKEGIELQLDWTDDFKDPRTGLRLKSTYDLNTSEDADSPEYYKPPTA